MIEIFKWLKIVGIFFLFLCIIFSVEEIIYKTKQEQDEKDVFFIRKYNKEVACENDVFEY